MDEALKVEQLPDGTCSLDELAADHRDCERQVAEVRDNATFYERTRAEEHVSQLGKLATYIKQSDPDEAVHCLRRQRELARLIGSAQGHPVEWWLRLPLFLQSAGRFDEAMVEFEALRASPPVARQDNSHMRSQDDIDLLIHAELAVIYDKMRLACRREGHRDKAAEYESLSKGHRKEWEILYQKLL